MEKEQSTCDEFRLDTLCLMYDRDVPESVAGRQLSWLVWYAEGRSGLETKKDLVVLTWLNTAR